MIAPGPRAPDKSPVWEISLEGADLVKHLADLTRKEFFGFFLIGVFSSLVDIGLLYLFTEQYHIWYLCSATASYLCGMLASYFLNKFLNFHDGNRRYIQQFSLFAIISLTGLGLNLAILMIAVEFFSLNYIAAKGIAIATGFFWNYFGQSRITFRKNAIKTE